MEALINMALLTLLAVGDRRHHLPAQPVRRRRPARHLQLPDGERSGRARRGRRGDDGGFRRRGRLDGRCCSATLHLIEDHRDAPSRRHDPAARGVGRRRAPRSCGAPSACRRSAPPTTPIHTHVAPRYIADTVKETQVPNVVTSVLADYRGYDTLGETTVIFTAGIGVMLLLRGAPAAVGQSAGRRRTRA